MTPEAPPALRALPAYRISETYRLMRHALDDSLREIGLTTPQFGTLACLESEDWKSGADMARMHKLTPQTMNTILHNLEHVGFVRREPHPENGTILRVHLTDSGRQRLQQAMERVEAVQARMLLDLSSQEVNLLTELLGRCIDGLRSEDAAPFPDPCS